MITPSGATMRRAAFGKQLEYDMKQGSTLVLAALAASCIFPLAAHAKLDDKVLPKDAVSVCQENIDGHAGEKATPAAIDKHQYASSQAVEDVLRFYEKRFGRAPTVGKDGTFKWTFKEEGAQLDYFIHARDAGRFWYDCDAGHAGPTVIMVSTMHSSLIRAGAADR